MEHASIWEVEHSGLVILQAINAGVQKSTVWRMEISHEQAVSHRRVKLTPPLPPPTLNTQKYANVSRYSEI